MYRERRAGRWISTHLATALYDRIVGEAEKKWADGRGRTYFMAWIEARALGALFAHFVDLCTPCTGGLLRRLALQVDGDEVITEPFPTDLKKSKANAIDKSTGYQVSLKKNYCANGELILSATSASREYGPQCEVGPIRAWELYFPRDVQDSARRGLPRLLRRSRRAPPDKRG